MRVSKKIKAHEELFDDDVKQKKMKDSTTTTRRKSVLNQIFKKDNDKREYTPKRAKSIVYTILNDKSKQLPAEIFKYFISFIIFFDFIVFAISTDPEMRKHIATEFFVYTEGITSTIFLLEYLARMFTITERKTFRHAFWGRLKYATSLAAMVDLWATLPYFMQHIIGYDLPQMTYLRVFRLFRILKTTAFVQAAATIWRVLYYNRHIMYISVFIGLYMVLITSVLMYHLRPRDGKGEEMNSMLSTMYLSTLMLTGRDGPEGDLPWYTKGVCLLTSAFSIGLFAVPISMLTWGFEAEAARVAKRERQLAKRRKAFGPPFSSSSEEYSTEEEYQKILVGEDSSSSDDDERNAEIARAIRSVFMQPLALDLDGSRSVSLKEVIQNLQYEIDPPTGQTLDTRVCALENKMDSLILKIDRICDHLGVEKAKRS